MHAAMTGKAARRNAQGRAACRDSDIALAFIASRADKSSSLDRRRHADRKLQ
jgi:hypothetical protein